MITDKGNISQNINYQNGCNRKKRRNYKYDFDSKNTVINMNDMKKLFREYMVMKMEKDFEEMIKNHFSDKDIINDDI